MFVPMKMITAILFCFITSSLMAQTEEERETPYNPTATYNNWSLRATALPYIIGNGGGISTALGVEYGFFKRHSFAVDGLYHVFGDVNDTITDTSGVKHDVGNRSQTYGKALLVSYRYHLNRQYFREVKGLCFYLTTFYRLGDVTRKADPTFNNDYVNQFEKNKSIGIGLGGIKKLDGASRFGLDVLCAVYYRQTDIRTEYLSAGRLASLQAKPFRGFGIRVGVLFDYWFFRE